MCSELWRGQKGPGTRAGGLSCQVFFEAPKFGDSCFSSKACSVASQDGVSLLPFHKAVGVQPGLQVVHSSKSNRSNTQALKSGIMVCCTVPDITEAHVEIGLHIRKILLFTHAEAGLPFEAAKPVTRLALPRKLKAQNRQQAPT